MAWNDSIVTNAGTVLLNESLAGRTLSITSAVGGTGTVESTQLVTATKLVEQKQELTLLGIEIVKVEGEEKEGVKVKIQITNKGLQESYQLQQVAVLARLNGEETDTMLFIMQDEKGIFIPSISDTPEFLLEIYAIITMTNDADIQIIVDSSAVVSENYMRESLNNAIAEHNNDPEAHGFKRHVIAERTRDPGKPNYGLGGGGVRAVALDISPCTGASEVSVVVSGTEYDANNLSENMETAKSGTLIIKKLEE